MQNGPAILHSALLTLHLEGRDFASRKTGQRCWRTANGVNAPASSCSQSKRGGRPQGPFRLRSVKIPSALNSVSGLVAVRQHLRPCEVSASRPNSTGGKWPAGPKLWRRLVEHLGIAPSILAWKVLADGHQRVSLNTYARKMESRAGVTPA